MAQTIDRAIALPLVTLSSSAAIGAWLGFSACGGYAWHAHLGHAVLALSLLVILFGPGTLARRGGLAVLVASVFILARGAGSAAYLGADDPAEYLRQVGSTFGSGLC